MTKMNNAVVGTPTQVITTLATRMINDMVLYVESAFKVSFPLQVKLAFDASRKTSNGGISNKTLKPVISMALSKYILPCIKNSKRHTYIEYSSFAQDFVIGSFVDTWQKGLAAILAHEIAHAIQFYLPTDKVFAVIGRVKVDKTHGEYFRQIYAHLRRKFINFIDIDTPYTLLEEKPEPRKIPRNQQLKKVKTSGVRMEIKKSSNGWFIHDYFEAATNKHLGRMASKPRCASQGWVDGVWVVLRDAADNLYPNHPTARKAFIGS
jgi:hypothetical protein